MSLILGKYKLPILYSLAFYGPFRYNELKRFLDPISFKTLTTNLKELEKGKSLIPVLDQLCDWVKKINKINNSCLFFY